MTSYAYHPREVRNLKVSLTLKDFDLKLPSFTAMHHIDKASISVADHIIQGAVQCRRPYCIKIPLQSYPRGNALKVDLMGDWLGTVEMKTVIEL